MTRIGIEIREIEVDPIEIPITVIPDSEPEEDEVAAPDRDPTPVPA